MLASTNKGDLILDPFTGSSTTGIAAYLLGRNFIGIDTEKEFLDVSIKRFEELDRNLKNKFNFNAVIPGYVSEWTDKYFHQSAFDKPVEYPSEKVVNFLKCFKKPDKAKLYRGINHFNKSNKQVTSWTYDKQIAKRYASETKGEIFENEFYHDQILLDTTALTSDQKRQLGYDYKIDDKEVLILSQ